MSKNTQQDEKQRTKLITNIFQHFKRTPPDELSKSILLISFEDDSQYLYQKIFNQSKDFEPKQNYPIQTKSSDTTNIIDCSSRFLTPQVELNFITTYFILKSIQEAKFILVFNETQTRKPLKCIKQTLERFISLFSPKIKQKFYQSIAIIINSDNSAISMKTYQQRLKGILQPNYIRSDRKDNIYNMIKTILQQKNIQIFDSKKNIKQEKSKMECFLKKIPFYPLSSQQKNLVQASNKQNYKQLSKFKIESLWVNALNHICENISQLIIGEIEENKIESQIFAEIKIKSVAKDTIKPKSAQIQNRTTKDIASFLAQYLFYFFQPNLSKFDSNNSQIVEKRIMDYVKCFTENNYLNSLSIGKFMRQYFLLNRIFQNKWHTYFDTLMKYEIIDTNIKNIFQGLLLKLDQDCKAIQKNKKIQYDFVELCKSLNKIIQAIQKVQNIPNIKQHINSITPRNQKKIKEYLAKFQYYHSIQISQSKQKYTNKVQAWKNFLETATKTDLISKKFIFKAFNQLGKIFLQIKSYQIAIRCLRVSMVENFSMISYIYEQKLEISKQKMPFVKDFNAKYLKQYCQFLLQFGLNERVRQICIAGLSRDNSQQQQQIIKQQYINALEQKSRKKHQVFLEDRFIKNQPFKIDKHILDQIKSQL